MARRHRPLHPLAGDQALAAEPRAHVALSASAGTGKTQVLTARVLRLLLSGVRPESILCLTFTKAGAAEMANRLGGRLAAWVRMADQDLKKDLFAIGERDDPATRDLARRLFARVLDAPGGLKIQTIHSFAQSLLAAFPAEAGIAPGFEALEGRAEQELVRRTLATLMADAEAARHDRLFRDIEALSMRLGEADAIAYLRDCAAHLEPLRALGPDSTIERQLRARFGLPEDAVDDFLATHCGDDHFDCDLLRAIAAANRVWATGTGSGHAEVVDRWLALDPAGRAAALPELALVVFTGKGEPRKVSAGQIKADPEYERHAARLAELIAELVRIQSCARLVADMAAGLRAGRAFAEAYTRAKAAAGVADFGDLIAWTKRLLTQPGMGDWVRYKLDRQVDHVLVDEAQDTNADQWTIIEALAEEYFSGASEADRRVRTLLMVGDFKQAIFRFQGTDPREFEAARVHFRTRAEAMRAAEDETDTGDRLALEFRDLSISASFRSAQPILDVVDSAIREVGFQAMGLPEGPPAHVASRRIPPLPGRVELWRPFAADNRDEDEGEEGWLDERERRYATALAGEVKGWLDQAPLLASTRRPLTPGDILILVRSRGELASLLVARLFAAGVPVAGIDRLHLQDPFAIRDLLAAIAFAVQPLDDLNLANLLVSPLLGWSQEQLLDLAYDRDGSLWQALRARASERADFTAAHDALGGLLRMADFTTPARFLETILSGPMDGRRKLYSRLTLAARDPIDELLASALDFERREIPSLDRFLAWFNSGDVEIKREAGSGGNAVRVMTVHGAKGLEAPFVILGDATADPKNLGRKNQPVGLATPSGPIPLLRGKKGERPQEVEEIIARDDRLDLEEHWRLLYVGLTRAIERLVVSGIEPRGELAEDSWHKRMQRAMAAVGASIEEDPLWGQRLVYTGDVRAPAIRAAKARQPAPPPVIPEWALRPAPVEARPPRPLAPSSLGQDLEAAPAPTEASRAAARRGTLIHQLLERLPDVAAENRNDAARRWLGRSAGENDPVVASEIADTVCAILSHADFAPLFGPGSLGEAPIAATLHDGRVIAGTVDRLLIEDRRVSVIDFKTGRAPADSSEIPAAHRAQMAAYAEALRVIFPGREVRASLLYTAAPRMFALDG